jgi:Spy/CpxP family protein refolding chaperone
MNRTAVVCVLSLLLAGVCPPVTNAATTAATLPAGTGNGPLKKLHAALVQLDLSAGQKEQIHKIMQDARGKLEALKSSGQPVDKSQVRPIIKAAIQEIAKVLTPEQKQKLHKLMQEARAASKPG